MRSSCESTISSKFIESDETFISMWQSWTSIENETSFALNQCAKTSSKTKEKTKHFSLRATRASYQFEHWQLSTSLSKRSSFLSNRQLLSFTSISQVSSSLQACSSSHSSIQTFSSFALAFHSFSSFSSSSSSTSHFSFEALKLFSSTRSLRRRKWRRDESERSRRQRREFDLWFQDRICSRRFCKRMSWEESKAIRSKSDNSRKRIVKEVFRKKYIKKFNAIYFLDRARDARRENAKTRRRNFSNIFDVNVCDDEIVVEATTREKKRVETNDKSRRRFEIEMRVNDCKESSDEKTKRLKIMIFATKYIIINFAMNYT